MAKVRWLLLLALGLTLLITVQPAPAIAQATIRWEASIDSAKRSAAQSNRLVLVIFTAPQWCIACRGLESDLNSQPSVGQAIETNYVAVRINADYYPNTAKQYNVKALPTTLILAPTAQGEVLDVIPQRLPLDQYLSRLNRVADDTRRRNGALAQLAGPPARTAPAALQPNQQVQPNLQLQPNLQAPNPQSVAMRQPLASTQPGTFAAPNYPSGMQSTKQPDPSIGAVGMTGNMGGPSTVNPARASPNGPNTPNPNPPIALDGFCPVRMIENSAWTPGQKAIGAVHLGRTYLFAGETERRRFMANPDRYAPLLAGSDIVVQIEQGRTLQGTREHGVQYGGHVYLFVDEESKARFSANPKFYAERAAEAARTNLQTAPQVR